MFILGRDVRLFFIVLFFNILTINLADYIAIIFICYELLLMDVLIMFFSSFIGHFCTFFNN